jgi:hypothetical protein
MSEQRPAEDEVRTIRRHDLEHAAAGILSADQVDALWRRLDKGVAPRPRFDLVHLLWYAGALVIIGAMGMFTTLAFAQLGGAVLVVVAVVYAVVLTVAGDRLWRRGLRTPGGLLIAVAVTMAPLAIFGAQDALGWWTHADPGDYRDFFRWIKASWLPMEIATIVAGCIALRCYRFPFLMAPVAMALWFMSMDLVPWIFGEDWHSWEQREVVSLWFGLAMMIAAWVVDVRARGDFAFWLHLFGILAFWGGLTMMESGSEIAKAFYCVINVGLLALSLFLQRRVYAVFGALGVAGYMSYLAADVFGDSLLYPFALSLIGLAIIGAGLLIYRHAGAIEAALRRTLPQAVWSLRPAHAREASGTS